MVKLPWLEFQHERKGRKNRKQKAACGYSSVGSVLAWNEVLGLIAPVPHKTDEEQGKRDRKKR